MTISQQDNPLQSHEVSQLYAIFTALPTGVLLLDGEGRITRANPAALTLLGEPLEGQAWRQIIARCFQPREDDGHEISLRAKSQSFRRGELIVRQGSKTDDFYIISSGTVEIFRKNESGKVVFSTAMKAGNFFGENMAMGYADKRNASAKAVQDVSCLVLPGRELRDLALRMPVLRHQLHVEMKRRGVETRILEKATPPPTEVMPVGQDPKS